MQRDARDDAMRRDDAERIAALAREAVDRATAARADATHLPTEVVELDELDLAIAAAIAQRAMLEIERRTGALLDQVDAAIATLHAARIEPAPAPASTGAPDAAAVEELRRWVDDRLDEVIRAVDVRLREITAEAHEVARATAAEVAHVDREPDAAPLAAGPATAASRALMSRSVLQAVDLLVAAVEAGQLDEATAAQEIAELQARLLP